MSPPFPLRQPSDVRRAFAGDTLIRRIGRAAQIAPGSKLAFVGVSSPGQLSILSREFGCDVQGVEEDAGLADAARKLVASQGLSERLVVHHKPFANLALKAAEFDAIFVDGRIPLSLTDAVAKLRPALAPKGRMVLVYPVRVGRVPNKPVVEHWEARLGEKLLLPRELLETLEKSGFEPQTVESLSDAELDELHRSLEAGLGKADAAQAETLKKDLELHRGQGGKSGVSFALVIARRKEPGERPPASRTDG